MRLSEKGSFALEVAGFGILSVILFEFNVFLLIFVIPLTILYHRRGFEAGFAGSILALAGIGMYKLYGIYSLGLETVRYDLFGIDMIVPGTFLLGLCIIEVPYLQRYRLYQRMLLATLAAGIVSLPLLLFVMKSPEFDAILRAQIQAMIKSFVEGQKSGGAEIPFAGTEQVVRLSRIVFLDTYLAGYFLTLAVNWVIGVRFAQRSRGLEDGLPNLRFFHLPDAAVWPFLTAWFVVLVGLFRDIGPLHYVFWNVALLTTLLFGFQGAGIVKVWMDKLERGLRMVVAFMVVFLVFVPGINMVLIAGIPLLGVSELWIHYRNGERS